MDVSIIINHYNSKEFLDLTETLDDKFKIFIYNKSNDELNGLKNNHKNIKTENIGREGHSYLNHIIENYDNLSDINVFIQDDFYNHLFNINYFNDKFQTNKNNDFYQFPCSWRSGANARPFSRTVVNGYVDLGLGENYEIKKFSEKFNINLPQIYSTETCAHFLVSKKMLLRYEKEFYNKILDWLLLDKLNGYTLEHAWKLLFI
jgi:hypothetical protein